MQVINLPWTRKLAMIYLNEVVGQQSLNPASYSDICNETGSDVCSFHCISEINFFSFLTCLK